MRPALLPLILTATALFAGCAATQDPAPRHAYGVWQGVLPCADCPGIDTRLTLYRQPDTYRLEETYQERDAAPVVHEGRWALLPPQDPMDLGRVQLEGANERPLRSFRRLPDGNLEMLGRDGEAIRSPLNYTLTRKRLSEGDADHVGEGE
ncbi:copper resistance protein NlpE [Marinobacter bohaiensis]|uniref:copper resistance protein NlpE n=1 Tax=Marinobacter bohaiensis TaxID=2201898 RepID=UPI000DACB363|nr:copper resistance protein NlpE [Marinobacter bohaiensis]